MEMSRKIDFHTVVDAVCIIKYACGKGIDTGIFEGDEGELMVSMYPGSECIDVIAEPDRTFVFEHGDRYESGLSEKQLYAILDSVL